MLVAAVDDWTPFFTAEVAAAAALAGLLFVAMSINVKQILAFAWLPIRAIETLVLLVGALLVASAALVPGLSDAGLGAVLLVLTAGIWLLTGVLQYRRRSMFKESPASNLVTALIIQGATLPGVVGAVTVAAGNEDGLYLVAFGILASFIVAVITAWVLLVEVLR